MNLTEALSAFTRLALKDASRKLLAELGYTSDKHLPGLASTPEAFEEAFTKGSSFDKAKALFSEWKSADLIFQYTEDELTAQKELQPNREVSKSLFKSYVFIAIELKQDTYARGAFSAIARQVNRVFPMPVMVLFKHGNKLTIAVINRRRSKLDEVKDVLEKATLIREINLSQPHRGHLDILTSLIRTNLVHPQKLPIKDFDSLHAAWEQIFNVELLNQRFYRDLSNWYFWALPKVEFPSDLEPDDEKRRATGLIRLLTRLIFCWFLKEKDLIPDKLFQASELNKLLKGFDPESEDSSVYYQAILQNLFFATLNQKMGKDSSGRPYRGFASDDGFLKNRVNYDVNNLYRYESLFAGTNDEVLDLFADIPFLNGGLFECLDRTEDGSGKKLYIDGFSRNQKKRPRVPDQLFFDSGETADLSEAYGDAKRKSEKVSGLISILSKYKFTIIENTPIDQEIALDPELLGKVFENLLASYNEETKTTARKQTGSFYTPRSIVDYMVDESIKAHLASVLSYKANLTQADSQAGLDILFAYTEKAHAFNQKEVSILIAAIDSLKVLDPACGSGAFPMGILHKLVYILGKLDPNNDRWKSTQLAKIDSAPMREELERAFIDNNDDYGRKLYLIENCLYGVDIQPIAIQITKLRFFISLVCDQKTNRNKKDNHGVRPLPNLETKFIAANSLVGLPELEQLVLVDPRILEIEKEIESHYHRHFSLQRRDQKISIQLKIKGLRAEMANLLSQSLMSPKKSGHIADWDPFDPQASADFFDSEWMFGRKLSEGFDVVIGNPPYGVLLAKSLHDTLEKQFTSWGHRGESYVLFIELSLRLAKTGGVITLIIPDTFTNLKFTASIRRVLQKNTVLFIDSLPSDTFESAVVDTALLAVLKKKPEPLYEFTNRKFLDKDFIPRSRLLPSSNLTDTSFNISLGADLSPIADLISSKKLNVGEVADVFYGIKAYQTGKGKPAQTPVIVESKPFTSTFKKAGDWLPFFDGKDIARYINNWRENNFIKYGPWLAEPRRPSKFEGEKILVRKIFGETLVATYVPATSYCNTLLFVIKPNGAYQAYDCMLLLGIINSRLVSWYIRSKLQITDTDLFPQIMIDDIASLPLPESPREDIANAIRTLTVKRLAENRSGFTSIDAEIDRNVFELYGLTLSQVKTVLGP